MKNPSISTDGNSPSVSIIIVAKDCANRLDMCLRRIRKQIYSASLLEILVVDGGSRDHTVAVAGRYGARIVHGGYPENPEARRYIGALHARNEIIAFIDADNMIPHENWLQEMVRPFVADSKMLAAFTRWYGYAENTPAIDQYYALIGGNDPIAYYLGKHDRVPYLKACLPNGAIRVGAMDGYDVVRFDPDRLPVIGCNGFLIRRKALTRLAYDRPEMFFHTDVNLDIMVQQRWNRFAIVHDHIIHLTGDTVKRSIRKRVNFMRLHHRQLAQLRRYNVFDAANRRDVWKLFFTVLRVCTFVEPCLRALNGCLRTGNLYWCYHPVVSFLYVLGYGLGTLMRGAIR